MSAPARKSRIAEMHWSYSSRQEASCESKLRRPVQCWQHLHKNFLPEVRKASPMLQKTPVIRSRTLLKLLSKHIIEKMAVKQGSKIHDFCLGIPYKVLLVVGGLLGFIITGSTAQYNLECFWEG
jgi:hypothetical protein